MKYFIFVVLVAVAFAVGAQTYPVVWTQPITSNVTINANNSLTKPVLVPSWNAGAVTENALARNADGYVEFTYAGGDSHYMVGLSTPNVEPSYTTSNYSLLVASTGTSAIYYRNGSRSTFGNLAVGDVLRLGRVGTFIKVHKNGVEIYSDNVATSDQELRVDVSIYKGSIPVLVTSFRPLLTVKAAVVSPVAE